MKRVLWIVLLVVVSVGCIAEPSQPQSASGVGKAEVKVKTGSDGLTVEQRNVRDRITQDNKPGAIQHLYLISAYSGQVLLYSTVRGKVTSSGKRLTPTAVRASDGFGINVEIGGEWHRTPEVLGDDGTYGSSVEYIYWWDARGIYHQHYVTGGQIVHVASEPIAVKSVVINLELK